MWKATVTLIGRCKGWNKAEHVSVGGWIVNHGWLAYCNSVWAALKLTCNKQ